MVRRGAGYIPAMTSAPRPVSAWARRATLALHAAVMVGLVATGGRLGGLLAMPLLAPLPGLWRGRPYTYAATSLFVVLYAGGFLMEASTHAARRPVALALATLAALEFCALVIFVRLRGVELRRAASAVAAGVATGTPASPDRSR
jgi:uncharacterized membrane protein